MTDQTIPTDSDSREIIDMQEAIDLLKTTRPTFYRWLRSGKFKGMKAGRQWRFYKDDIERFVEGKAPRVSLPADIKPLISSLEKIAKELKIAEKPGSGLDDVHHAVETMLLLGFGSEASDIHLDSMMDHKSAEKFGILRYRINGVLHEFARYDDRLQPHIIEGWKSLAGCHVNEKVKSQDGRIIRTVKSQDGTERMIDMRVAFVPAGMGESMTLRILDSSRLHLDLKTLPYHPDQLELVLDALKDPWGMIICSGPTGSGKTTTMYCCLNEVTGPDVKVMSVEDPIEYYLPWVNQVAVDESSGMTFEKVVRSVGKSDPDVVMIGEIRNQETLKGAQLLAMSGHLVLTQLHVRGAAGAIQRMIDNSPEPYAVADSTRLVISQVLARKLCPECSKSTKPDLEKLALAEKLANSGGLDWKSMDKNFREPVGCEHCAQLGYKGRTTCSETMRISQAIEKAIKNKMSMDEIEKIAIGEGMVTMAADGVRRAANGETTLDEAFRVLGIS
ncbi:MAG TPA: ATPase, T2SS/T4P/T4SS family [bacterium]|jgi:excisionase family DNA binding protein